MKLVTFNLLALFLLSSCKVQSNSDSAVEGITELMSGFRELQLPHDGEKVEEAPAPVKRHKTKSGHNPHAEKVMHHPRPSKKDGDQASEKERIAKKRKLKAKRKIDDLDTETRLKTAAEAVDRSTLKRRTKDADKFVNSRANNVKGEKKDEDDNDDDDEGNADDDDDEGNADDDDDEGNADDDDEEGNADDDDDEDGNDKAVTEVEKADDDEDEDDENVKKVEEEAEEEEEEEEEQSEEDEDAKDINENDDDDEVTID